MGILMDEHTWLIISFIGFLAILWVFGKGALLNALDAKIKTIQDDIKNAESLRVEAQEMLAQYQRKHRDAEKDAKNIIENARTQVAEIQKKAEADLEETLARREKQLAERLERMKQNAKDEILEHASSLAIAATTEIIMDKLDQKANEKLVDDAIKAVGKNIH